jgi:hypothetical protein
MIVMTFPDMVPPVTIPALMPSYKRDKSDQSLVLASIISQYDRTGILTYDIASFMSVAFDQQPATTSVYLSVPTGN